MRKQESGVMERVAELLEMARDYAELYATYGEGSYNQMACGYEADLIARLASALAEARAATLEEAAKVCEAMRPHGGRAWSEGQEACYAALSDAAKNIRALSTGARA